MNTEGHNILNSRGIAMVLVLWVVTLLSMIAAEFSFSMRVETHAVRNYRNEAKAYYLALAGLNLAVAEIRDDYDLVYLDAQEGITFLHMKGGKIVTNEIQRSYIFDSGKVTYTIADESGKLNVNTATRVEMEALLKATGVDSDVRDVIVDSILDWRDANHEFHLNGAEDDYYLSLGHPYEAKDGLMDTATELLLVKGVSPNIFYGTGNLPLHIVMARNDDPVDMEYLGIEKYITVFGDGKLNINTADEKVLEAVIGKGRTLEIMVRRQIEGFFEQPIHGGSVTSSIFSVESEGEADGIVVSVKAILERIDDTPGFKVNYWHEGA